MSQDPPKPPQEEMTPQQREYDHIRDLARRRMLEMEEHLKRDHNMRTRCGVEVEFFVHDDDNNTVTIPKKQFNAIRDRLLQSRYVESLHSESDQRNRILPVLSSLGLASGAMLLAQNGDPVGFSVIAGLGSTLGYGGRFYLSGSLRKVQQYEFVLGDKGRAHDDADDGTRRMGCFKAAIAADYMKYVVAEELRNFGDVTYKTKPRADNIVSGIHLNISLSDMEGNNLFSDLSNGLCDKTAQHLKSLQRDAALIFLPNENALERIKAGNSSPKRFGVGTNKTGINQMFFGGFSVQKRVPGMVGNHVNRKPTEARNVRVENRLPCSDTDTYLTALVTMGAVCNAADGKEPVVYPDTHPGDLATMKDDFKNSSQLEEVLGRELYSALTDYIDKYGNLEQPEMPVNLDHKAMYSWRKTVDQRRTLSSNNTEISI